MMPGHPFYLRDSPHGHPSLGAAIDDADAVGYIDLLDRRWAEWRLVAEHPAAAHAARINPVAARVRVSVLQGIRHVPRPDACRRLAADN